ncbi:MAG: CRISPR-associated endonuclease Cas2 [Deltaproteobacteria bacterium]|nr:CRISPR-associated endonuclease Cas2 [Deltaproteobacteria bacterium]
MRRCYLVCYDIRDPKRLRRVHKAMKGYGEPWQFSVFFCVLKNIDRVRMQTDLETEMNQRDDQILVIDMGGDEEAARNAAVVLGQSMKPADSGMVVV